MAMLTVGNDRLWFEDDGGDSPAVVLLHPGIHDSTVWDALLPHVDGLRVIRYDRRAFGRSPAATEPYRHLDDLLAVLDRTGVTRAHLVGNSQGGEIAIACALEHPARVASLTLLAPAIEGYPWPDEPELEAEWEQAEASGDPDALLELLGRIWCRAGFTPYVRDQLLASRLADPNEEQYAGPTAEQWSRVAELAVPTAVVVGVLDRPSFTEAGTALAGRITGARLVRLDGADHLVGLRAPVQVAALVRDQVGQTPG